MPEEFAISIIQEPQLYLPTITVWNRIEGRPRAEDYSRALKAEVRDPLWLLSKQYQTGEFQGEDAGSALLAKVHIKTTMLTKYQAGDETSVYQDDSIPLEARVEQQPIAFTVAGQEIALELRLQMGRHWLRLLRKNGLNALRPDYLSSYGISKPNPELTSDAQVCADLEVWQHFAMAARDGMDGYKLYIHLKTTPAASDFPSLTDPEKDTLNDQGERFIAWYEKLYTQPVSPEQNPSWKSRYLEYQFACSAPKEGSEQVFQADEYYHGHLDWYNLDIDDQRTQLPPMDGTPSEEEVSDSFILPFIPSAATFPGMPHSRWWQFEDWKTDLGKMQPDTTDINQLMVLDFGLNYANDWLLLPFTLPTGSIANVEGLMVTNSFGEKTWITAAGEGDDEEWNRWSMFHLNTRGDLEVPQDLSLVLLPAATKVQESLPLEEVYLLRDEVANMVWGVEAQVPLPAGKSKRGKEVAIQYRNKLESLINKVPPTALVENEAKIRYQIVNKVPEHWIPFVPVHIGSQNRAIQLQRAAMPRLFDGDPDPPKKVEPRTTLLREGLDKDTTDLTEKQYFVHEEEVPRSGARLFRSFQRTRWYNGKTIVWVGHRKSTGRGEGHSGLAFDQIIPKDEEEET